MGGWTDRETENHRYHQCRNTDNTSHWLDLEHIVLEDQAHPT